MKKLMVGLPCYNEEENISPLIEKWMAQEEAIHQKGYQLKIHPLDDKSTDGTRQKLEEAKRKEPVVEPLFHEVNQNLGGSVKTLFHYFITHFGPGDLLVLMDGDNTHDPVYLLKMLETMKEEDKDVIIASRYQKGAQVIGVPPLRLVYSFLAGIYYRLVLSVKNVKDYTCGYRLYRYEAKKRAYESYGENLVERTSFACMMEVLYKLARTGATFGEIPFILRYDYKKGSSKIPLLQTIWDSVWTAASLRFHV